LADNEWLADDYSIADIANWCWVRTYKWSGVSVDGLNNLKRWRDAMREQPGMTAGLEIPVKVGNLLKDKKESNKFSDDVQKVLQV